MYHATLFSGAFHGQDESPPVPAGFLGDSWLQGRLRLIYSDIKNKTKTSQDPYDNLKEASELDE
jgi:hypothetical protein